MNRPRDANGHFVKTECIHVDCDGRLRPDEKIGAAQYWRCDGLRPMGPDQELDACDYGHMDGEPLTNPPEAKP